MPALETILGYVAAGAPGAAAVFKTWLDRSEVKKKLDELEKLTLPALEQRIQNAVDQKLAAALAQFPALERRTTEAVIKLEAAVEAAAKAARATARGSRSGTGQTEQLGAAIAEMASLRRELEAVKGAVDGLRQVSPVTVQRVGALEERLSTFEEAYRDDYSTLLEKVSGITGEVKQALRGRNGSRSTDSG